MSESTAVWGGARGTGGLTAVVSLRLYNRNAKQEVVIIYIIFHLLTDASTFAFSFLF